MLSVKSKSIPDKSMFGDKVTDKCISLRNPCNKFFTSSLKVDNAN